MAQESKAEIKINNQNQSIYKVPKTLYGGFFEYVLDVINGTRGVYAQEIINRGFDMGDCWGVGLSCLWPSWVDTMELAAPDYYIHSGGVNPNGAYYQEIKKKGAGGSAGICQKVYVADNTPSDFYIYFKGDSSVGDLLLSFRDTLTKKIYYEVSLGKPSADWKKITKKIPALSDAHLCHLVLTIKGIGSIYLDEASFMPENNVFGIRKEIYDLYKNWSPGIMRYPGGWVADFDKSDWKDCIGPIDERTSPKMLAWGDSQRMDFGTDEFVAFCKDIGAEPHIVLPFMYFEPDYSANWIEYCNGDTTTKYGKLRAQYGHPEPYNIRYWEVGNEQWSNTTYMANRYVEFYQPLKSKDDSIKLIMCGNIWGGYPFFDTCATIAGPKMEIYGWHWGQGFEPNKIQNDSVLFLNALATLYYDNTWYNDPYLYNLVTGLWTAMNFNLYTRHARTCEIGERTSHSGLINYGYNMIGQRVFVPSPSYYAVVMMTNHHGNVLVPCETTCETFNTPYIENVWPIDNVPYLDVAATSTEDTLFLSVVNLHTSKPVNTKLNLNSSNSKSTAIIYELSSPLLGDANTINNPNHIIPKIGMWTVGNSYIFPPHSYTILAIPIINLINEVTQKEKSDEYKVNIYPNPASDMLQIDYTSGNFVKIYIKITNEIGLTFYENSYLKDTENNLIKIDTKNFPFGTYFCTIKMGNYIKTSKFIIIR
ncbi:MAG: T9SS type A sorting domain-containing protein [FCB group bacterium]